MFLLGNTLQQLLLCGQILQVKSFEEIVQVSFLLLRNKGRRILFIVEKF